MIPILPQIYTGKAIVTKCCGQGDARVGLFTFFDIPKTIPIGDPSKI